MLLPAPKVTTREKRAVAAVQAEREIAFALAEPEPYSAPKPRWAKSATRKGEFGPEMNKPGTRFAPPVPRGQGPRKMFAAT